MKILRVTSCLRSYVLGGIRLHIHRLSLEQCKHGDEVTVIDIHPPFSLIGKFERIAA